MTLTLNIPNATEGPDLKPRITVVGVGGAGGNAVNNMIHSELDGVEFIVANTDAQALAQSKAENRIQLGAHLTKGLGAGSRPDVGRGAAEETLDEILQKLDGRDMVFITCGMGGGTGTGAAPIIARAAREVGILTVGVVTKPFDFEGPHRMRIAEQGIEDLKQFVDTLIIIPNQNLFRVANEKTTFADAFKMADDVLYSGVRGVTDLMVMPGLINLDFADIRSVMSEMGKAMMGTGEAEGERRALDAAEAAISNPLLDDNSMNGARGVLINITGGGDMTLFEVDEAANRIRSEVDDEAYIIFGSTFDQSLEGKLRVSVVATGIDRASSAKPKPTMLDLLSAQGSAARKAGTPAGVAAAPTAPVPPAVAASQAAAAAPVPEPAPEPVPAPVPAPASIPVVPEMTVAAEETPNIVRIRPDRPAAEPMPAAAAAVAAPAAPTGDAFIPPAPAERPAAARTGTVHPFTVPETVSTAPVAADEPTTEGDPGLRRERGPSLFERVTGTGRAARLARVMSGSEPVRTVPAPASAPTPRVAQGGFQASARPAVVSAPTAPNPNPGPTVGTATALASAPSHAHAHVQAHAQAKLDGLDPSDRLTGSAPEDDLLDIPAFLRRQAN